MMEFTGFYIMMFLLVELSSQQRTTVRTLTSSNVRLSCACARSRYSGNPDQSSTHPAITWTFTSSSRSMLIANWTGVQKDVVVYSSTNKYHMLKHGQRRGDLVIFRTSLADQGDYICEVTRRCTVSLHINVPVSEVLITFNRGPFLKPGNVVMILEETRAFFQCYSFGAKPAAHITWSLSHTPIRAGFSSVSFRSNTYRGRFDAVGTLRVSSTTMVGYNDKQLTCWGSGAGNIRANSSVMLRVVAPLAPPTITGRTNVTLSNTQRSVILTCSTINSFPPAIIQWSVGDQDHSTVSHHQKRRDRYDVTSHLELPVDGSDDGLEIGCKVSSPLQSLNKTVKLSVLAPPISMSVNWTERPVKEGESLTVLCTAFGANPKPYVYWEASSRRLHDAIWDKDTATSLLHLSSVTRTDAGLYSCLADNHLASTPLTKNLNLEIQYEPTILTTRRSMNIPRSTDIFNLTCVAEANPIPVIEWTGPSSIANFSQPITDVFGTTIVSHLQIHGGRGDQLPFICNITCLASNIVGRTSWTVEIRYGFSGKEVSSKEVSSMEVSSVPSESYGDINLTVSSTIPNNCHDTPRGIPKMPVERPILIALISACLVFLVVVLVWRIRRHFKADEFWLIRRDGFYVDMSRRRAGIPGIATVDEEAAVSSTTSPRLTPSSGTSIRFEFVSQQSVENTYDSIPVAGVMPPALQPRRRRIRSADGYFYDVPPPPRGFDTIRRVQSRRLPNIPTVFVPPQTMQEVLRSLSRDTGEMERPTLEHQPGGRSETILREEVQLVKKSQLRRVLSL